MSDRPSPTGIAVIALGLGGIAVSAYLTVVHYSGAALACVQTSLVDCEAVTTSSYSLVPGTDIPVSIPGILWSLVVVALGVLMVRGAGRRADLALLVWSAAAMVPVLWFVRAEIVVIGRICLWCTVFHAIVLVTLLVAVLRLQGGNEEA